MQSRSTATQEPRSPAGNRRRRSGPTVRLLPGGALAFILLFGGGRGLAQDRHAPDGPAAARGAGGTEGPVLRVTVLRAGGAKSLGLDAQLAAFQPACGRLLVGTNAAPGAAGEFQLRFSWRAAKDAHSSNGAPSLIAADAGAARRALLAAMADSYPEAAMNRREMVGTPAILSMEWQKGRILIVSPHPEAQAKTRLLVARAIAWTLREDPRAVQRQPASAAL